MARNDTVKVISFLFPSFSVSRGKVIMDWTTHLSLALLRTSANTFLCPSDRQWGWHPTMGGWQYIIDQMVEPNGRPSIM